MKTLTSASLDSMLIKPVASPLVFGAGYLQYLSSTAAYDDELASRTAFPQPVRYLGAVDAMMEAEAAPRDWSEASGNVRDSLGGGLGAAIASMARPAAGRQQPSLREAVIALREAIRAS